MISFAHNIKYLFITKFKSYDDPDFDDGKNENFDNDYDDDDDDCRITFASCRFLFAFIVNQYP